VRDNSPHPVSSITSRHQLTYRIVHLLWNGYRDTTQSSHAARYPNKSVHNHSITRVFRIGLLFPAVLQPARTLDGQF